MTPDLALGLGFAIVAFGYLLVALLRPERF